MFWYAGRDSNPQPSEPESDALSIEPPAHIQSQTIIATFFRFVKGNFVKWGIFSLPIRFVARGCCPDYARGKILIFPINDGKLNMLDHMIQESKGVKTCETIFNNVFSDSDSGYLFCLWQDG